MQLRIVGLRHRHDHDGRSIKMNGKKAAVIFSLTGSFAGGVIGLLSLGLRTYLTHGAYSSRRYWNTMFLELLDGVVASGAGAVLGARLGWLLGSWRSRLIWKEKGLSGGIFGLDWLLIGVPAVVLVYLFCVTNFG